MGHARNMGVNVQEYVYDFSVHGGAASTIELSNNNGFVQPRLPLYAIVKSVTAYVKTAVTSDGSATVAWGHGDTGDGYSGTAIAKASLGANVVINGWDLDASLLWDGTNDHPIYLPLLDTNDTKFTITIGAADLTAGKIVFMVEYYYPKGSA